MIRRGAHTNTRFVGCPTCGQQVPWTRDSRWRPFCSERCRLIDLGEWLEETHRISEPAGVDLPPDPEPSSKRH